MMRGIDRGIEGWIRWVDRSIDRSMGQVDRWIELVDHHTQSTHVCTLLRTAGYDSASSSCAIGTSSARKRRTTRPGSMLIEMVDTTLVLCVGGMGRSIDSVSVCVVDAVGVLE